MESMRVVCIDTRFYCNNIPTKNVPFFYGDILEVLRIIKYGGHPFYEFVGIHGKYWDCDCFRPVDDTFGPAVCERIEEQIEYEKAIEV